MKLMMFLGLFALAACQSQQKPDETSAAQTDTVLTEKIAERKEPIIIESLPGIDVPDIIDGDTVYTNVDTPPVFSEGDLNDYLQEAVKDIHVGEAVPIVMFVVSKAGYPCHVAIRRSAKVFIPDSLIARKIDSIACGIIRDLPYFIPASLNGKLVNRQMVVAIEFK